MKLSHTFSRKQCMIGLLLMALDLMVFPILLKTGNRALGSPLNLTQLNFLLFVLNFLLVLLLFWDFLRSNLKIALRNGKKLLSGAGKGFLMYYAGAFVVAWLILTIRPEYFNINDRAIDKLVEISYPMVLIGTVLLVPTAEEVIYRGLLFSALQHRNRFLAYAVSACVFSLVHLLNYLTDTEPLLLFLNFLQYLPAGIALCWAYEQADSIFAPILIHTAINLLAMVAMR